MMLSPTAESSGPMAEPTVQMMAVVTKMPERSPCGMLSAKMASVALLDSSLNTPRRTNAAYRSSSTSVTAATTSARTDATPNTQERRNTRARLSGYLSTSKPTGMARNRLERPEMLSVAPTKEFLAVRGSSDGPRAWPKPRYSRYLSNTGPSAAPPATELRSWKANIARMFCRRSASSRELMGSPPTGAAPVHEAETTLPVALAAWPPRLPGSADDALE